MLSNKGFGFAPELGGGGAYAYYQNHKVKNTAGTSTSAKNSTQTSNSTHSQAVAQTYTANDAVNLVQSAYTTAMNRVKGIPNDGDQGDIDAIKSSLSASLYSRLTANVETVGYDQVLCAQMYPDSVTASLDTSTNGTATVFVNETFGSTSDKVATTVDLSSLKITNITCPQ